MKKTTIENVKLTSITELNAFFSSNLEESESTPKKQGLFKRASVFNKGFLNNDLFNCYISTVTNREDTVIDNWLLINQYLLVITNLKKFKEFKEKISLPLVKELSLLNKTDAQPYLEKLGFDIVEIENDIVLTNLNNLLLFNNNDYKIVCNKNNLLAFIRSTNKAFQIDLSERELNIEGLENE